MTCSAIAAPYDWMEMQQRIPTILPLVSGNSGVELQVQP